MSADARLWVLAAFSAIALIAGCASSGPSPTTPAPAPPSAHATVTHGHVVVVMMENRSYADIIGNPQAPYLNELAREGASLTRMYAIRHPSEPNYLALFSGSTQGLTSDGCPHTFAADNLGHQLLQAGLSFAGYSEGLPRTGDETCTAGLYARKHVPWTNFSDLPASVNQPLTNFPSDYSALPTVSFVIPNLNHDMHNGTTAQGDAWLRLHLSSYVTWAASHGSLLIVVWDEDDRSADNQIPTIIVGAGVSPAQVTSRTTTYSLLRLVEARYGLALLGGAATAPLLPAVPR
jgi:phosphatidylinositol-3-phosphatase